MFKISNETLEKASPTRYFERALGGIFADIRVLSFFENSFEDISIILMRVFVEKLFHRTVRGPTACNFNRKAPFIWVLQGFTELLKNTYFKDHHSMAASKRDASEIF